MARKAGGQAVFEGVMMRGDDRWAVAVRTPSGALEVLTAELVAAGGHYAALYDSWVGGLAAR